MTDPVQIAVKSEKGQVVLRFDRSVDYLEIGPRNAKDIACAMTDAAFEADTALKPAGDTIKAALIERHFDVLVPRIALMLTGMREDKKLTNGKLAEQICSVAFNEIFK